MYTDSNQDHYEVYGRYFDDEDVFLKLAKELLIRKGVHGKVYKKIFLLLRLHWMNYSKTPHFDELFVSGEVYAKGSKAVLKSSFRTLGLIGADDCFNKEFFDEYIGLHKHHADTKKKFVCEKRCGN